MSAALICPALLPVCPDAAELVGCLVGAAGDFVAAGALRPVDAMRLDLRERLVDDAGCHSGTVLVVSSLLALVAEVAVRGAGLLGTAAVA